MLRVGDRDTQTRPTMELLLWRACRKVHTDRVESKSMKRAFLLEASTQQRTNFETERKP